MTTIVWDVPGERVNENGVSHGVFYGADTKGVPWNGLTSVEESISTSVEPLYFDGFRYADIVTVGDFEGKMRAYTYPDEFLQYEGLVEWRQGFSLADQVPSRFGLSYRTEINTDLEQGAGYKIHLLYNVLAVPTTKSFQTLALESDPIDFEWDITALPEEVDRFRPTAHIVLDSRRIDPFLLSDIEDLIYGTAETDAYLPDLNGLVTFVQKWARLIITDDGEGYWTATSPLDGVINMLDADSFEIITDTATYLDADTYTISSSELDLEDV
jgi:hypothetical protein